MVRLCSVLLVATSFAVASAAPHFQQQRVLETDSQRHSEFAGKKCLPEITTTIRQNHLFQLKSYWRNIVSLKYKDDLLVVYDGQNDDKSYLPLELCIVTSDQECTSEPEQEFGCVYEDVEYYIRVQSPVQGYFYGANSYLSITKDYQDASYFSLSPWPEYQEFVFINRRDFDGDDYDLQSRQPSDIIRVANKDEAAFDDIFLMLPLK
ncbi:hypothetical protein BG000_006218 [Podila horticola]|nr:hypothetical protein BG000_006218 [Podila horticola]